MEPRDWLTLYYHFPSGRKFTRESESISHRKLNGTKILGDYIIVYNKCDENEETDEYFSTIYNSYNDYVFSSVTPSILSIFKNGYTCYMSSEDKIIRVHYVSIDGKIKIDLKQNTPNCEEIDNRIYYIETVTGKICSLDSLTGEKIIHCEKFETDEYMTSSFHKYRNKIVFRIPLMKGNKIFNLDGGTYGTYVDQCIVTPYHIFTTKFDKLKLDDRVIISGTSKTPKIYSEGKWEFHNLKFIRFQYKPDRSVEIVQYKFQTYEFRCYFDEVQKEKLKLLSLWLNRSTINIGKDLKNLIKNLTIY